MPIDVPAPSRHELTPAQHAHIRLQIALLPVYLWLFYGWKDLLLRLPLGLPGSHVLYGRDFIQFYVQGVVAHQGHARDLYDIDAWTVMIPRLVPGITDMRFPPIYGPQLSVLFSAFARLPYGAALSTWMLLSLVMYLGCGYAIWNACPRLRDRPWTVALLLLADPGLHFALGFGQVSAIGLLCVTCGFLALRANRSFVAGLAIGSLVYKPQLGLAAAFVFVGAGEWRIVLGALVGAVLQMAIGCAFWGPSILGDYVRSLVVRLPEIPTLFEAYKFHMHSLRGFFDLLGLRGEIATSLYAVTAGITAIVALQCWRARGPLAVRYAVMLLASVLIDPHLYVYDFILLVPAFLLLWDWALAQGPRTVGDLLPRLPLGGARGWSFVGMFQWLLYFCYVSPLLAIVAVTLHVQLSVPALMLLGGIAALFLLAPARQQATQLVTTCAPIPSS